MEKKTKLVNIYLKIHQKRDLTLDDLRYLAHYDPECFKKTCKNVVYNIPQAKPVILQQDYEEKAVLQQNMESKNIEKGTSIDWIIDNLKSLENQQNLFGDFDVERVKNLLGNLYMELLFPHNDTDSFFDITEEERGTKFDKKA